MSCPNILFILIDDLGWADLGCYGSTFYETPVLDALAAGGLRLTDAYAASPVCSPTRASLLTGKYPSRVGITQYIGGHAVGALRDVPYFHQLPQSEIPLPGALREGGYQTWHVGKWHLGAGLSSPENSGFDTNIGGCELGYPHRGHFAPFAIPGLEAAPGGTYLADWLTGEAIRLLHERDQERPFFLNLWHYGVHTPVQAPEALVEKYRAKSRKLGLDSVEAIAKGERFQNYHQRFKHVERRTIQSDPVYAAMVENLDTNIGRLLKALAECGLEEETLVIFTSDNGGLSTAEGSPTCNFPLREGKGWANEGGLREPWILSWPQRITPGSISSSLVTSPDLYPTLLEVAGLPMRPQQHEDGVSFLPLLDGVPQDRGPVFWHYPHYSNQGGQPSGAVRDGKWKLIEYFADDQAELFDLQMDIGESHNLASEEPQRVREMRAALHQWRVAQGALIPTPNPHWKS